MSATSQLPLALDRLPPPSFSNFHAGPNAAAVATLRTLAAGNEGHWLALVGPGGSGKTHLLSALVSEAVAESEQAVYLSGRWLADEARYQALRDCSELRLLCIDDLDRLLGNPAGEEALFHTLNDLRAAGSSLAFSVPSGLATLEIGLPDLRSRLATATRVRLEALSDADKIELLNARARGTGIELEPGAAEALLRQVPRDAPSLVGWLDRLAEASLAARRRITARFVHQQLRARQGNDSASSSEPQNDSVV
ncbi:MAG: DnaA/Hda family protein [Xanthomonadales bacterium]|nr:DnaA/Hda family protein [Xanthomonadales bacterium]